MVKVKIPLPKPKKKSTKSKKEENNGKKTTKKKKSSKKTKRASKKIELDDTVETSSHVEMDTDDSELFVPKESTERTSESPSSQSISTSRPRRSTAVSEFNPYGSEFIFGKQEKSAPPQPQSPTPPNPPEPTRLEKGEGLTLKIRLPARVFAELDHLKQQQLNSPQSPQSPKPLQPQKEQSSRETTRESTRERTTRETTTRETITRETITRETTTRETNIQEIIDETVPDFPYLKSLRLVASTKETTTEKPPIRIKLKSRTGS